MAKRKGYLRWIKRLLFVVIGGIVFFVLLLSSLIVPEMTREVSAPSFTFPRAVARGDDSVTSSSLAEAGWGIEGGTSDEDIPDIRLEDVLPFSDPSKLPDELRPLAEEWNRETESLFWEFSDFEELQKKGGDAMDKRYDSFRLYWEAFFRAEIKITGLTLRDEMLYPPESAHIDAWFLYSGMIRLRLYVLERRWDDAAMICAWMQSVESERRDYWWDCEVYYWRQQKSWRGRRALALRTVVRASVTLLIHLKVNK